MLNRSTTKLNLFVLTLTFLIYLFLGAQLFSSIERPAEQIIINEMSKTREDFVKKYPCVKGLNKFLLLFSNRIIHHFIFVEEDFESFICCFTRG